MYYMAGELLKFVGYPCYWFLLFSLSVALANVRDYILLFPL